MGTTRPIRMFVDRLLSYALLLSILAAGCGERGESPPEGIGRVGPIVVADVSNGSEQALLGGELAWAGSPDQCLDLAGAGVRAERGVVWPNGTTWDDETSEVVLPSGDRLGIGDSFELGGGWHFTDQEPAEADSGWGLTSDVLDAAEVCGWRQFAYVQSE